MLAAARPLNLIGADHALNRVLARGFKSDWPEDDVMAFPAVCDYVFDAAPQHAGLTREHVAHRLGLPVDEVTEGIVNTFDHRHGLHTLTDLPGPGPPVTLAAHAFTTPPPRPRPLWPAPRRYPARTLTATVAPDTPG